MSIEQLRQPGFAGTFQPTASAGFSRGYDAAAWWYRVALQNSGEASAVRDWVLEADLAVLDFVDVYVERGGRITETYLSGDHRSPSPQQLPARKFAFPLALQPGEKASLYVRVLTAGPHAVTLKLHPAMVFDRFRMVDTLWYGAFLGFLIGMLLYNLVIGIRIRDSAYIHYVLALGSSILVTLIQSGYARLHGDSILPEGSRIIPAALPSVAALISLCFILFTREFLRTRTTLPRSDRLLRLIAWILILEAVLAPLVPYTLASRISMATLAVTLPAVLGSAIVLMRKGSRPARLFLVAWAGMFLSVLAVPFSAWGLINFGDFTDYAWQVGLEFAVIVFALALADRLNAEQRERHAAAERAERLKSFMPQNVAGLVGSGDQTLLRPSRRRIVACVIDLRGFTPFSERTAPEEVMAVLEAFFSAMGEVVDRRGGTVEYFAGDSMLIIFNAPLEVADPEKQAAMSALEMRLAFERLREKWSNSGHELGLGIGLADGHATTGAIGFSGRLQYSAIGPVVNLAARLCSVAAHGEILATSQVVQAVESWVETESAGEQQIKGFSKPVRVHRLQRLKESG